MNGVKLAEIMFSLVCVCVCARTQCHWFGWAEWRIRLVREKLRIFPYGQYIVGTVVLLAFWRYSQFQDRSGGWGEMYKNVTPFPMDFPHTPQHSVHGAITPSLAGVYCACTCTLLGRRICKHADVYMITLSCSWRIYYCRRSDSPSWAPTIRFGVP